MTSLTSQQLPKIVLVGSPNVGKSVIFGLLTGRYATVSNYPGTTVEVSKGTAKIGGVACEVIDTPGLYSIYPITDEERVTLKILKEQNPHVIVHIIDAKNLERMLPLTFQLLELGIPVIVVLNMFDELLALGMNIKTGLLSEELRLPVVATVAVTNQGIGQLIKQIKDILNATLMETERSPSPPPSPARGEGEGEGDHGIATPCQDGRARNDIPQLPPYSDRLMKTWYKRASKIVSHIIQTNEARRAMSRLDKMLISPFSGFLILAVIIYLGLYQFVGKFGAGTVVNILENAFQNYITPWLAQFSAHYISWSPIRTLFVGEYGMITLGLRYALAIILPIVGLYFLVFAIIEDSGYLPRLAYLLDAIFKKIGLSGRAVIPMVLGLGCDTMATMVVRTLATKRERIIATLLLSLTIPCSAQMGVILGLLASKPAILIAWGGVIVAIFLLVGTIMAQILPGEKPVFVIEIPPMRLPKLKNVFLKTAVRMQWYFKEIIPLFLLASVLIWFGQITGILDGLIKVTAIPLKMMGLPPSSAFVFIFGFFRRDYGAAGLYDLNRAGVFTNNQLFIAIVVLTLFLPCIAQLLITIRERGLKIATAISVFVLLFAFGTGVALNGIMHLLRISF
jgi:ferrous iron transport protein B